MFSYHLRKMFFNGMIEPLVVVNGVVRVFLVPNTSVTLWNKFDSKFLPWLDCISIRTPNLQIPLLISFFATVVASCLS